MPINNSPFEISLSLLHPTRVKAKHIRSLNRKARIKLWDMYMCFNIGERWDELTPIQKIVFEEYATIKLLELVALYNRHVLRSIHYGLREKTPEEENEKEN